ncbi:MAG TPA: GTP-binding protein [Pararobbsia sp.]|nr:GTP-binding protein [Pararobbsia sp.]
MTDLSLPVTLLCGFSRAGKTAVREQLATLTSKRIATIDDAEPLSKILALAADRAADAVVLELPDWADPMSVAESWVDSGLGDIDEPGPARIDTIVTVVDATHFLADLGSSDSLADRAMTVPDADDRTVGEVIIEQIEFCDVLLIQRAGEIDPQDLDVIRHVLAKLNPRARLVDAQHDEVATEEIVDTGRFDFEAAASAPGWLTALDHNAVSLVRDDAAGVGMFVYRARRPFHPARFFALLHNDSWSGVLRSRGYFWIASRNDMAGTVSQIGHTCRHGPAGYWWVAQPADEWPDDDAFRAEIAHDWYASPDAEGRETVGDRRQELVLIGRHLDRDAWQHNLDACLLTDAEFDGGPEAWLAFEDPFPEWTDDHEHEHGDEHDHHE